MLGKNTDIARFKSI